MSLLKAGRPSVNKEKSFKQLESKNDVMKMNINILKSFHKEVKRFALENDMTVTDLIQISLHEFMSK